MTTETDETNPCAASPAPEELPGVTGRWAPQGPGAARMIAYIIAGHSDNPHSHLSIDGEIECASGHCTRPPAATATAAT